jgi:hypothetical protein
MTLSLRCSLTIILAFILMDLSEGSLDKRQSCGCSPRRFRRDSDDVVRITSNNATKTFVRNGDMLLDPADVAAFKGFRAVDPQTKRWPRGNVKYYLNGYNSEQKRKIYTALSNLSQKTQGCVSFTEVRDLSNTEAKVDVKPTPGCFSIIGMAGTYWGPQQMSLGSECLEEQLIQHEFIHALGFYHEQDRPDRDRNIRVNWNNIHPMSCDLFKVCKACKTFGAYDLKSIMHYSGDAGACEWGKPTMVQINGKPIEYNRELTQLDIQKVRALYECRGSGPSPVV